jgi:hypothetical protein
MFDKTKAVMASAILLAFAGSTVSAQDAGTVDPTVPDSALVMGPGTGESVGGFTQAGRLSTHGFPRFRELQDLQAVGDRLVVRSAIDMENEVSEEVILHSTDAMTWIPATLPGEDPEILDLATTAEGLLAAGSVMAEDGRVARLWASADGVYWSQVPAPAARRVHQIVSTTPGAMGLRQGNQLWVSDDGSEWTKAGTVVNSSILAGPGGVLTWQGGGQDRTVPTVVLHQASLTSPISEVTLPEPLQWKVAGQNEPFMGIDVFALDDAWVMVGSEHKAPDSIHVSSNGLTWEDVPRPAGMREDAVRWITRVGDQVQAFGQVYEDGGDRVPEAIWTWQLGEEAGEAEALAGTGDEWINEPVAWGDRYVATGYERNADQSLTLWLTEADPAE